MVKVTAALIVSLAVLSSSANSGSETVARAIPEPKVYTVVAPTKAEIERIALKEKAQVKRAARTTPSPSRSRAYARILVDIPKQFKCLKKLWSSESGWRHTADNPGSSAYGIPQALPGNKMGVSGGDWRTNPVTQIHWGLKYIESRYGSPCKAWSHFVAKHWY